MRWEMIGIILCIMHCLAAKESAVERNMKDMSEKLLGPIGIARDEEIPESLESPPSKMPFLPPKLDVLNLSSLGLRGDTRSYRGAVLGGLSLGSLGGFGGFGGHGLLGIDTFSNLEGLGNFGGLHGIKTYALPPIHLPVTTKIHRPLTRTIKIHKKIAVPIPHPILVPVERLVPVPSPFAIPVERPFPVPVPTPVQLATIEKPLVLPIEKPVAIPAQPVHLQVTKVIPPPQPVEVRVPVPKLIPTPVIQPIIVPEKVIVPKPVPIPQPVIISQPVPIPHPVPVPQPVLVHRHAPVPQHEPVPQQLYVPQHEPALQHLPRNFPGPHSSGFPTPHPFQGPNLMEFPDGGYQVHQKSPHYDIPSAGNMNFYQLAGHRIGRQIFKETETNEKPDEETKEQSMVVNNE